MHRPPPKPPGRPTTTPSTPTSPAPASAKAAPEKGAGPHAKLMATMPMHLQRPLEVKGDAKAPPRAAPTTTKADDAVDADVARQALQEVASGKKTWAEVMNLTRQEAFGMAQGAYRLFEFGQHQQATKVMEALVIMNPKAASFHALLGGMLGRMGDDDGADVRYSEAIRLEPKNLAARVNRAELRLKRGQIPEALEDLVAATAADPKGQSPLGRRAHALAKTTSTALKELIARHRGGARPAPARPGTPAPGARPAPKRLR